MDDYFDNWTVQLRKGLLELCVLSALVRRERYGFELVRSLAAIPGLGITEGTVYPLLSRLRLQGFVTTRLEESPEGPPRKYYALTREGRKAVSLMGSHLRTLSAGIDALGRGEES